MFVSDLGPSTRSLLGTHAPHSGKCLCLGDPWLISTVCGKVVGVVVRQSDPQKMSARISECVDLCQVFMPVAVSAPNSPRIPGM